MSDGSSAVSPAADKGRGARMLRTGGLATDEHVDAAARLAQVLESMFDPFILMAAVRDASGELVDLRYVEANDAAVEYNGIPREELIGSDLLARFPGQLDSGPLRTYFHCIETGEPVVLDDYAYPNEVIGEERRYDIRAVKSGDGIALTWRDVTDRYRAMREIADRERRYRMLAEHASDVVWEIDEEGRFSWISDSITRVLGWTPQQLLGHSSLDLVHPDEIKRATANRNRLFSGDVVEAEFRFRTADGDYRWMLLRAHAMPTDKGISRVAALRDINDEVAAREKLEQVTRHDALTGLPTRTATTEALAELLAGTDGYVGVLCIGVDKLGRVNEALGHPAGDLLIVRIAERIVKSVRDPELVGRGGGDEFIVVVPALANAGEASIVADRVREHVIGHVTITGRDVEPTVSVGVTMGLRGDDADALLREASLAMRAAKAAGGNAVEFGDPAVAAEAQRDLELEAAMHEGLRRQEFMPWYQPIVDLRSEATIGYEALARWMRPGSAEPLGPNSFMNVAARSSLIMRLDEAIITRAIHDLTMIPAPMYLAVNTSTTSLAHPGFAEFVVSAIERADIDASRLHLEVTETELIGSISAVRDAMDAIARSGVRWYVDDFGTGYSSISHLRDLPIAGLKLDRSFTESVGRGEERGIRLAQGLVGLAGGLELDTVAEGIECEDEVQILAAQGWRSGQGWLFGVAGPLPQA